MKTAGALIGLFLVSYFVKVFALGREALELWEPRYVHVLRFHDCASRDGARGRDAFTIAPAGVHRPDRAAAAARARSCARTGRGRTALVSSLLGAPCGLRAVRNVRGYLGHSGLGLARLR